MSNGNGNGKLVEVIVPTRNNAREVIIQRSTAPSGRVDARRGGRGGRGGVRSYAAAGEVVGGVSLPDTRIILRDVPFGTVYAMADTMPPGSPDAALLWITENFPRTTAWRANVREGYYQRDRGQREFENGRNPADVVIGARPNTPQWLAIATPDGPVRVVGILLSSGGIRDLTDLWRALGDGTSGYVGFAPRPFGSAPFSPVLPNMSPIAQPTLEESQRSSRPTVPRIFSGAPGARRMHVGLLDYVAANVRVDPGIYYELTSNPFDGVMGPGQGNPVPLLGPAALILRGAQVGSVVTINGQPAAADRLRRLGGEAGNDLAVLIEPGVPTDVRVTLRGRAYTYRGALGAGESREITLDPAASEDIAGPFQFTVLGAPTGSLVAVGGVAVEPTLRRADGALSFLLPGVTLGPDGSAEVVVTSPTGEAQRSQVRPGGTMQVSMAAGPGPGVGTPLLLMPTLSTGTVRVTNAPEGTTLTVDGVPDAKGGAAAMDGTVAYPGIPAGSRAVVATSPSGESRSAQVAVTAGGTASLKWDRMAVVSGPGAGSGTVYGVVRVSGVPEGAILTTEGSTSPAFTSGGMTTFPDVVAGARLITAELADGSQRSMRVNVTREGLTIPFDSLVQSREPRTVPTGTVRISGLPEGAQVTVNGGSPTGASRSGGEYTAQLPPGEHRVLVELANGELRSATVTVASNGSTAVAFDAMRQERPATQQPPTSGTATVNITHVGSRGPSSRPMLALASDPNTPIPLSTSTTGPSSLTYSATVPLGNYIVVPGCRDDAQGRLIPQRALPVERPGMTYTVTFDCDNGGAAEGASETPPSMEGDIAPDPALPPTRGRLRVLRSPSASGPVTVLRIDQQPPPAYITMPAAPGVPGAFESILEPGMYLVTDGGAPDVAALGSGQPGSNTRVANVSGGFTSTVRFAMAPSTQANITATGDKAPAVTTTMLTDAPRGMGRIRLVMPFVNAPTPFVEGVAQGPGMPAQRITMRRIGTTSDLPAPPHSLIAPGGTVIVPDDVFELDVAPGAYTVHSNAPGVALAGVTVRAGELVTVTIPRGAIGAGPATPVATGGASTGYAPIDAAAAAASGFRPGVKLPVGVTGRTAEGFRSGPIISDLANAGLAGTVAVEFAEVRPGIRAWYQPGMGMVAGRVSDLDLAGLRRLWTPILPAGFDGYGMER